MSDTTAQPPGGLSLARFKAICADVGQWTWGTVQGAFNEKASLSQIIVDAVIGMIPLVGDVTAVRDLIAVSIGMVDDPEKRTEKLEWVMLIVLVFALIPVLGGVIKGVGRIAIMATKEAALLVGAARAAHLTQAARDIVAFLNRIGVKNAEKWFQTLRIGEYQAQLVERFHALMDTLGGALVQFQKALANLGKFVPARLNQRIEAIKAGCAQLKEAGSKMIPEAVRELDQQLKEIQAFVRSGGETTSRTVAHEVAVGERAVTRADEARLAERGPMPARTAQGWKQNTAVQKRPSSYAAVYQHEPGYPNLTRRPNEAGHFTDIEAFSGRIINRPLKPGEKIFRLFGPEGVTHNLKVEASSPRGGWWGVGPAPQSAKEWREKAAVLDEFNRDGYLVTATVPSGPGIKACVGTVSEQGGQKIPGQFLPGGWMQAVIDVDQVSKEGLEAVASRVMASGKAESWVHPLTGMEYEIKPTGWTDANGIWGYVYMPGPAHVQALRLSSREAASKDSEEVFK